MAGNGNAARVRVVGFDPARHGRARLEDRGPMSTPRRQSFGVVTVNGWPEILADETATAWESESSMREWLRARGVPVSGIPDGLLSVGGRTALRLAAIKAWAVHSHPAVKWPGRVDNHWMNSSGLRSVEQLASRALWSKGLHSQIPF